MQLNAFPVENVLFHIHPFSSSLIRDLSDHGYVLCYFLLFFCKNLKKQSCLSTVNDFITAGQSNSGDFAVLDYFVVSKKK